MARLLRLVVGEASPNYANAWGLLCLLDSACGELEPLVARECKIGPLTSLLSASQHGFSSVAPTGVGAKSNVARGAHFGSLKCSAGERPHQLLPPELSHLLCIQLPIFKALQTLLVDHTRKSHALDLALTSDHVAGVGSMCNAATLAFMGATLGAAPARCSPRCGLQQLIQRTRECCLSLEEGSLEVKEWRMLKVAMSNLAYADGKAFKRGVSELVAQAFHHNASTHANYCSSYFQGGVDQNGRAPVSALQVAIMVSAVFHDCLPCFLPRGAWASQAVTLKLLVAPVLVK